MENTIVGLKELRGNIDTYISEVKKGRSFIVVRRSKPVLKISSPDEELDVWESMADFTEINKNGVAAKKILRELRKLNA